MSHNLTYVWEIWSGCYRSQWCFKPWSGIEQNYEYNHFSAADTKPIWRSCHRTHNIIRRGGSSLGFSIFLQQIFSHFPPKQIWWEIFAPLRWGYFLSVFFENKKGMGKYFCKAHTCPPKLLSKSYFFQICIRLSKNRRNVNWHKKLLILFLNSLKYLIPTHINSLSM